MLRLGIRPLVLLPLTHQEQIWVGNPNILLQICKKRFYVFYSRHIFYVL